MILFNHLIEKRGEFGAGRALEITEFFQRNRRLRVAANVHRFGIAFSGDAIFGDGEEMRQLCAIEGRSAPQCGDGDDRNNNERQIAFHKLAEAREVSAQQMSRQVVLRTLIRRLHLSLKELSPGAIIS
jgi:hypothetical protein